MTGEFSFGLHFQRANTLPLSALQSVPLVSDNFAVVNSAGAVITPTNTTARSATTQNFVAFVDGRNGGTLQRGFIRQGFGLFSHQDRNRWELSARMQNIQGKHTVKYGFEFGRNIYKINTISTGTPITYPDPNGATGGSGDNVTIGQRVTNNFGVCIAVSATAAQCPASALTSRFNALITGGRLQVRQELAVQLRCALGLRTGDWQRRLQLPEAQQLVGQSGAAARSGLGFHGQGQRQGFC